MGSLADNHRVCATCPNAGWRHGLRLAGNVVPCKLTGRDMREHYRAGDCPEKRHDGVASPPTDVKLVRISTKLIEGPKRWAALHSRALAWDPATGDVEAEVKFITSLATGMGCGCNGSWKRILATYPFDPLRYFPLTVIWHNAVNEETGKPTLSVAEARAVWTSPS